jgi:hypothetical protein
MRRPAPAAGGALSATEAIKIALRRKANARLVLRHADVVDLLARAAGQPLADAEAAESFARELEGLADELGLQLSGEPWSSRLEIGKKGEAGARHFAAEQLARADDAQRRLSLASSAACWAHQLRAQARTAELLLADASRPAGPSSRTRADTIARSRECVASGLRVWRAIVDDNYFAHATRAMRSARIPERLADLGDGLLRALAALEPAARALALDEVVRAQALLHPRARLPLASHSPPWRPARARWGLALGPLTRARPARAPTRLLQDALRAEAAPIARRFRAAKCDALVREAMQLAHDLRALPALSTGETALAADEVAASISCLERALDEVAPFAQRAPAPGDPEHSWSEQAAQDDMSDAV